MQLLSLSWGILSLVGMIAGFMPFFGALNWMLIPFAVIGAIVSAIAVGTAPAEVSKMPSLAGLLCCGIAVTFGFFRLIVGFGAI
jgi:hypothetical protein